MTRLWAAALAFLLCATPAGAWGDRGHSIIAEIAQRHLTPEVGARVREIIGSEASLASLASWADDFKFTDEGGHTRKWHYVDIDYASDSYSPGDCSASGCIVTALSKQAEILRDGARPMADRRLALLLLIHLVGDSTQPFHCGERNHDGGANGVVVDFQGPDPDGNLRTMPGLSLHKVWDEPLVDLHAFSWGGYAEALERDVLPTITVPPFADGFAEAWINQCHLVERQLYKMTPESTVGAIPLGEDYQKAVQPIVEVQLATGALRLAAMLNALLAAN